MKIHPFIYLFIYELHKIKEIIFGKKMYIDLLICPLPCMIIIQGYYLYYRFLIYNTAYWKYFLLSLGRINFKQNQSHY